MQLEAVVARRGRDQGHRLEMPRARIQFDVEIEGWPGRSCRPGSDGYVGGHESQEHLQAESDPHCRGGNLTTRSSTSSPRFTRNGNHVPAGCSRIKAIICSVLFTGRPAASTS